MGENSGIQALTAVIRAITMGQIRNAVVLRMLTNEVAVGLCIGLIWATVVGAVAYLACGRFKLGMIIAVAVIINLVMAMLVGVLLPLSTRRFGIGPEIAGVVAQTNVVGFFSFLWARDGDQAMSADASTSFIPGGNDVSDVFDIAVIGSGPGGYRAAVLAALRGKRVAIVEKQDWGGCCLNRGCVPKKDWHHSASIVAASRSFAKRGITGHLEVNLAQAWEHQKAVVRKVQESYLDFMKRLGIVAHSGAASFESPHSLRIRAEGGDNRLEAAHVIVATGSTPRIPAGLAPIAQRILTTDMLFDGRPPPGRRVAVIGGGVIGAEFAFILTMFGREVHWVTRRAPLVRTLFSAQALSTLKAALRDCGVEPIQGADVASCELRDGGLMLALDSGRQLAVDWILLGTGRVPFTEGLGLDVVGVQLDDHGFLRVNEWLQTSLPHVYGIGDCISDRMTANQAMADAAVAIQNIVAGDARDAWRRRDPLWVPEVIYSAVELARIGLNEDLAEDSGLEPAVGFAAFENSPCALGQDDARGFVRLISDMDEGTFLGGEVVGREAGELIHILSLVPDRATALRWLARTWVNHPTRAEEFVNATETLASKWGLSERVFDAPWA